MLTVISSLFGFLSAGLPNVLNFFQDKKDKAHELAMMRMQIDREVELAKEKAASEQRVEEIKLEQISTKGFFDEKQAMYEHDSEIGKGADTWVVNLRASVRPVITYCMFGLFALVEIISCVYAWKHNVEFKQLVESIWSQDTQAIFGLIISFWFGTRAFSKK